MSTLDKVITRLESRKGDWKQIADDADVSYSWLTKLAQKKIPNPGIKTIERLEKVLKKAA